MHFALHFTAGSHRMRDFAVSPQLAGLLHGERNRITPTWRKQPIIFRYSSRLAGCVEFAGNQGFLEPGEIGNLADQPDPELANFSTRSAAATTFSAGLVNRVASAPARVT